MLKLIEDFTFYPKVWSAIACELTQNYTHTASLNFSLISLLFCSLCSRFVFFWFFCTMKALLRSMRKHWNLFAIYFCCDSFTMWKLTKKDNTYTKKYTNFLHFTFCFVLFFFLKFLHFPSFLWVLFRQTNIFIYIQTRH